MEPRYENTGHVVIEWTEDKKGESSHSFNEKALKLQFHPKQKDKLVRACFSGAMPGWIKSYAEIHGFEVQQVTYEGETSWWMSKWSGFDENPFSSPTIKGAVHQFCKMIPFVCKDLWEKVKDNIEIIERNLQIDETAFEHLGLYFSLEQMERKQGCLLLEEGVIPERGAGESDEDYRNRIEMEGKLAELVWEITTPLPASIISEEELLSKIEVEEIEEEMDYSEVIDLDLEIEHVEIPILEDVEVLEEDDSNLIILEDLEEEHVPLELQESEKEIVFELEDIDETEYDSSVGDSIPDNDESIPPIEESNSEESVKEPITETAEILEEKPTEIMKIRVLKDDDKKAKALAGQMALF